MFDNLILSIFALFFLSSLISFIKNKNKPTMLYCGLFGFSGDPKVINDDLIKAITAKIKILGIFNTERGKHSCGLYMNGSIYKGVDSDKVFTDYIQNYDLPNPSESGNYTIIGHTRFATHGTHTAENAHPFVVNDLVLAHNGVIRNIWDLCNKAKVNHTQIRVDSLALAHLIEQEGFQILNHYTGAAALLMSKGSEPNSIYVYKGASRRTVNGTMDEERPMFFLKTTEGIYFSSMNGSLKAIAEPNQKVESFEPNVVQKITNGRFTKVKVPVNRETVNIGVWDNTTCYAAPKTGVGNTTNQTNRHTIPFRTATNGTSHSATASRTFQQNSGDTNCHVGTSYSSNSQNSTTSVESVVVPLIFHETLPSIKIEKYTRLNQEGVFYHFGRYWSTLDGTIEILDGTYYINKKGLITPGKTRDSHNYFFYRGVMLKSKKAYDEVKENLNVIESEQINFAHAISKFSAFPVCNLRHETIQKCKNVPGEAKYKWYLNQTSLKNYGFTPKWSDRNYIIHDGFTKKIKSQKQVGDVKENTIDFSSFTSELVIAEAEKRKNANDVPTQLPPAVVKSLLNSRQQSSNEIMEADLTNFCRIWTSVEQARSTLTELEINALRYYVADVMVSEMNSTPVTIFDASVDVQLNLLILSCVENRETLLECWNDDLYEDCIFYINHAEKNPDGIVFPSENEPVTDNTIKDNVMLLENATIIDNAVKKETAQIPQVLEVEAEEESTNSEVDRAYEIQDIFDFLCEIRNCAEALSSFDDNGSQEIANIIFKDGDKLTLSLRKTVCDNPHLFSKELIDFVNLSVKTSIGL